MTRNYLKLFILQIIYFKLIGEVDEVKFKLIEMNSVTISLINSEASYNVYNQ